MKKYQFLLLDAGPIMKLFELGLWEQFIEKCDVTVGRTIAEDETLFAKANNVEGKIYINLSEYETQSKIKFADCSLQELADFMSLFSHDYVDIIHDGKKEILAFLHQSSEGWMLCSADGGVFRVLGLLAKGEQGISLEEILQSIGFSQNLEWKYTQEFREKYTQSGQQDAVVGRGLR